MEVVSDLAPLLIVLVQVAGVEAEKTRIHNRWAIAFLVLTHLTVVVHLVDLVQIHGVLVFQVEDDLEDGQPFSRTLGTSRLVVERGVGNGVGALRTERNTEFCNVLGLEPHQECLDSELSLVGHVGCR